MSRSCGFGRGHGTLFELPGLDRHKRPPPHQRPPPPALIPVRRTAGQNHREFKGLVYERIEHRGRASAPGASDRLHGIPRSNCLPTLELDDHWTARPREQTDRSDLVGCAEALRPGSGRAESAPSIQAALSGHFDLAARTLLRGAGCPGPQSANVGAHALSDAPRRNDCRSSSSLLSLRKLLIVDSWRGATDFLRPSDQPGRPRYNRIHWNV